MDTRLKVLMVDAASGYYRHERYRLGDFFGPVDLGLFLAGRYNSLNIGVGLLAGSIFPGSNRMIFTGFSPCWGGFFISSMGGAGLVFDNLGINMLSITGKAHVPSIIYLNRVHGEEIEVEIVPVKAEEVWKSGRRGVYAMTDHVLDVFGSRYISDPRVLVTGPASLSTDFGAICSMPVVSGKPTHIDTWAGRGGFGSKLFLQHGIAAVVYGGTYLDDDFRDRKVADQWFIDKYTKKLAAKDLEATTKYRFEPDFNTGGTLGVNLATIGGGIIAFNYRSIFMDESARLDMHKNLIAGHYLKQFNEETIYPKQQHTCGEPCAALCKKMNGEFKKDYEPYQTMGPLSGIFDQRAAEKLNHHADMYGFDAISAGGIVSWLMECLAEGHLSPQELGVSRMPVFKPDGFSIETDSMNNAELGIELLDGMIRKRPMLDMTEGARRLARNISRTKGREILDCFLYSAYARNGWMVPNQYWTPGVLSPMPIMGKYYMDYGKEFLPPRELGRRNAKRMKMELVMDNIGMCRFHRMWAEDMIPEIIGELYGKKDEYLSSISITASRINSRNASCFWESSRALEFIHSFLKRRKELGDASEEIAGWLDMFEKDAGEAGLAFWYDIHKGVQESLREF
ncbi:MAG TPA: aldehyde ferredoxin oxidoreductase N-terminal domain-containing protein [Desulfomonilia bacterium]